ncbi:RHS repeat-associated core domain-containing protein [Tenacibaculum maritimum]|nr:RHS repeat-associated core domain-containing protein [Tenacibaculum maritimum]CAA0150028.1 RHS Repeat family protein [Tenacibaculum maritimum]
MYDEEGEQVWERSLDLNGKVINGSNAPCPFLYQGQYYDKEIELAYNRFRYYDPDDGRYISKDPIGLLSGEYGFYNYVGDSNSWVDPFGLTKTYSKKAKELQDGANGTVVTAKTKKEAHDILMEAFPGAQKVRGIGAQDAVGIRKKRKMDEFKKKDGKVRYRKDYAMDHETGRVHGHDDPKGNGHGSKPHINIKKADGKMVRIDIG